MKKILLIMLSIMFVILSCKTATAPIDSQRNGTYVSDKQVNGSSYLAFKYLDGGFKLYYSDKTGTEPTNNVNTVTADNISGKDPNYTFQTGVMAGSLQFLSVKIVKVTVTFNSENSYPIKDVLCYKKIS